MSVPQTKPCAISEPSEPPPQTAIAHAANRTVSHDTMFFYLTSMILPFSPHFSQNQKASLFVSSPPLALVAMSPAMRMYCEHEKPYRLGGAWFLSHEHTLEPSSVTSPPSTADQEGGDASQAAKEKQTQQAQTGEDGAEDEDDDADDDEDVDVSWAGSRTTAGLTMGALPAHLGSVRLFQYLENTPTSWIGFCTTVARALAVDTARVSPTTPRVSGDAIASPPSTPLYASYLYVVCTHPEGRLAFSLWWTAARDRRRRGSLGEVRGGSQRVCAASALVVCADLTFFGRVEKRGLFVPPLPSHTTAASIAGSPPPPPLLSYVFLHGAVTLAVEEELQQQWWSAHADVHSVPSTSASTSDTHALSKHGDAEPHMAHAISTAEADEGEAMEIVPLLSDCSDTSATAHASSCASASGAAKQFDPAVSFAVCRLLHVMHLRIELAEPSRLAAPQQTPRHRTACDGGVWDARWLARLFPHLVQLRVDGPPSKGAVMGRSGGRSGGRGVGRVAHADVRSDRRLQRGHQGIARHTDAAHEAASTPQIHSIAGLFCFHHLRSVYLRGVYFSSFPLYALHGADHDGDDDVGGYAGSGPTKASTPLDSSTPHAALAQLCSLPSSVTEVSVVDSSTLSDDGLAPPRDACVADSTAALPDSGGISSGSRSDGALALRVLSFVSLGRLARIDTLIQRLGAHTVASLSHLELSKTSVDAVALRAANLPRYTPALTVLRLTGTPVDDVNCLRGLAHLAVLNLSSSAVTPAGLQSVLFFPALRELYLMQCVWLVKAGDAGDAAVLEPPVRLERHPPPAAVAEPAVSAPPPLLSSSSSRHALLRTIFGFELSERDDVLAESAAVDAAGDLVTTAATTAVSPPSHRVPFPSLVCLDLSNNPLLSDVHLFPSTGFFAQQLSRCGRLEEVDPADPHHRRARGRRCVLPPAPVFPALQRLSVMHTAVASLSLLTWMAPRLRVLDASYTNVTSRCLCATPLPWTRPGASHASLVLPRPLRLLSLSLTGTPVTSLRALNPLYTPQTPSTRQPAAFQSQPTATTALAATASAPTAMNATTASDVAPAPTASEAAAQSVGFLWLPALRHLRLSGSDLTPEGLAAGFLGCEGNLRTLALAHTTCVMPTTPSPPLSPLPPPPQQQPQHVPGDLGHGAVPDMAVVARRGRQHGGPFAARPQEIPDPHDQAEATAEVQALLHAHPVLRLGWQPDDPARALAVVLVDSGRSLVGLDLAQTAVEMDAFFEIRRAPPRVAAAVRYVWRAAQEETAADTADYRRAGLEVERSDWPSSVTAMLRLLERSPNATPPPAVPTNWHVILWRLLLSGQLLEPRYGGSLHLEQLNLTSTPLADLVKEHVVAPARVQAVTLTAALAVFRPAHQSHSGGDAGSFQELWDRGHVAPHLWAALEHLAPKDVRGLESLVKTSLFGPHCTLA